MKPCISIFAAAVLIAATSVMATDPLFDTRLDYYAGENPVDAVIADLNVDGLPDLVVLDRDARAVAVLLNSENSILEHPVFYLVGEEPTALCSGDIDGDGDLDLAVANRASGTVSVLFNRGSGTFEDQEVHSVGSQPASICAADLNQDGRDDIVTANSGSGTVSVIMTEEGSPYVEHGTFPTLDSSDKVVSADFDGDGDQDLFVPGDPATVMLNLGDGTFTCQASEAIGGAVLGDFDGDGDIDIVGAPKLGPSPCGFRRFEWLVNTGQGVFLPNELIVDTCTGASTVNVPDFLSGPIIGQDIDDDGLPDLLLVQLSIWYDDDNCFASYHYSIGLYGNNGLGGVPGIGGLGCSSLGAIVRVADMNADAIQDLVVVDPIVSVVYGIGGGEFADTHRSADGAPIVAADIDNDGDLDAATLMDGYISVSQNDGTGALQTVFTEQIALPSAWWTHLHERDHILSADVDSDGSQDLIAIVAGDSTGMIVVSRNPAGTFEVATAHVFQNTVFDICKGDFNMDGDFDLAIARGDSVFVLDNDGTGQFAIGSGYEITGSARGLVSADIDSDGDLDLVVAVRMSGAVNILSNNGQAGFMHTETWPAGDLPTEVAIGDFNGDSNLDIAVLNTDSGIVSMLQGIGFGGFVSGPEYRVTIPGACKMTVADLNNDGLDDLSVGTFMGITVFFGDDAAGLLKFHANYGLGSRRYIRNWWTVAGRSIQFCAADADADGDLDLLTCSSESSVDTNVEAVVIENRIIDVTTGISDLTTDDQRLPESFVLSQNYPNPFNPATTIEYTLPRHTHVRIDIINMLGQCVRSLVDDRLSAGSYAVVWDGTDASGKGVATGVYLYRFRTDDYTTCRKMVLLR